MVEYTKTTTTTQPAPQRDRLGNRSGGVDLDLVIAYAVEGLGLRVWLSNGMEIKFSSEVRVLLLDALIDIFTPGFDVPYTGDNTDE